MTPFRMLYSITLIFILTVNNFLVKHFAIKLRENSGWYTAESRDSHDPALVLNTSELGQSKYTNMLI